VNLRSITPSVMSLRHRLAGLLPVLMAALLITLSAQLVQAQTYQIRPGDKLRIEVLEDPSLNRAVLVAPDGRITLPTAGTIRAAGQSVEAVQRTLTTRLAGNFAATPNVFVSLEELYVAPVRTPQPEAAPPVISIFVLGEVAKPGELEVAPGTNVLQAFAVMGGFTNFAAVKRIQLRRVDPKTGVQQIIALNYKRIEAGDRSGLTSLREGDTIVVPQRRLFE
jgi:polysaccharide export outer membrane protein